MEWWRESSVETNFWQGELRPHLEGGNRVEEVWNDVRATMFADEGRDYLTYDILPSDSELSYFYDTIYPQGRRDDWYNVRRQYEEGRWDELAQRIIDLTASFPVARKNLRVHDTGCGFGGLVGLLRAQGIDATGTDLSGEAVAGGRRDAKNEWIYQETAQQFLKRTHQKQHLIVLNHMIEHVQRPLQLVRSLIPYLEPGGIILVRCPNSQFLRSLLGSIRLNWYGYPKHLHYFGPSSIKKLLNLAGLTNVQASCTMTDMEIPGEAEKLAALAPSGMRIGTPLEQRQFLMELTAQNKSKELEALGYLR